MRPALVRKKKLSPVALLAVVAAVCLLAFAALNVWLADHPEYRSYGCFGGGRICVRPIKAPGK
jgi:hypothetical protein